MRRVQFKSWLWGGRIERGEDKGKKKNKYRFSVLIFYHHLHSVERLKVLIKKKTATYRDQRHNKGNMLSQEMFVVFLSVLLISPAWRKAPISEISTETKARFSLNATGAEGKNTKKKESWRHWKAFNTYQNKAHNFICISSRRCIISIHLYLLPTSQFVVPPYDYINRCFLFNNSENSSNNLGQFPPHVGKSGM